MATKKQKEELIEVLKFTPCTVTLSISGYGGETYAGIVDRKIYDFFEEKKIDMDQYAWSWDEELWKDVPDKMRPFEPGSPYDCDNFFHASGATLDDGSYIVITNDQNETILETPAGYTDLINAKINVECLSSNEFDDLDEGTVVLWSGQGEKGGFFEGEIYLTAPFDPKKLTIQYEDCDGWYIICGVEYNGEEIDGSDGYSTTGKWNESKWILIGGEEVYEAEYRDEDGESDESDEEQSPFETLADTLAERWNDISDKPPAKGEYECKFAEGKWPLGDVRTAEWSGRSWKENGKKAPEIVGWRKLGDE